MAANQAPPSLGFSRQEHWSGLPFPFPMHESEKWKWSHSVMSDSSQPHGLQPTKLLRPWDFPGKSTGVGCQCLLQESREEVANWKTVSLVRWYKWVRPAWWKRGKGEECGQPESSWPGLGGRGGAVAAHLQVICCCEGTWAVLPNLLSSFKAAPKFEVLV